MLTPFNPESNLILTTDASNVGIGAVMSQEMNGEESVVAYASRTLTFAERNYSTAEKEALAIVWAVEKWHYFTYGRRITIRTDHQVLKTLLTEGGNANKPHVHT